MGIARRSFLGLSIGTAAAPSILRLARADAPPTMLKLHHSFSAVSSVHDKFLAPWARKVEADSGGRLRIDLFPSMQLGGAPAALFDQVRDGSADIVLAAPSLTPGRFPKIETFELPFVASHRALVSSKALADFAAVNLQDEFREVLAIGFSCSDRAVIHANRPVRTIEDLKNLKLHVQTRFAAEAMQALGAQAVIMPSAQLPVGITEHVVDACLDPWHLVPPLRLNDLLRSHTEFADASPSARTYVLAMNKASYDRLPRDLKNVIDSNSGLGPAAMAGAMWDIQAAAVANMVVERGDLIVTLLPETVARWRKAAEPVLDTWRKEIKERKIDGAKLIAAARALLTKYASEPEPQPPQTPSAGQQAGAQSPQDPQPTNTPISNNPRPPAAPASGAKSAAVPSQGALQPPPNVAAPTPAKPPSQSVAPIASPAAPAGPAAPAAPAAPAGKPLAAPVASTSAPPSVPVTTPASPPAAAPAAPIGAPAPAPVAAAPVAPPPPASAAPAGPVAPLAPKPLAKSLDIRL